jgi:hypothetical protein
MAFSFVDTTEGPSEVVM